MTFSQIFQIMQKTRFDTSNYGLNRPLPKGKNKEIIELMKDELDEKIMTECVIKKLNFNNSKHCLEAIK